MLGPEAVSVENPAFPGFPEEAAERASCVRPRLWSVRPVVPQLRTGAFTLKGIKNNLKQPRLRSHPGFTLKRFGVQTFLRLTVAD